VRRRGLEHIMLVDLERNDIGIEKLENTACGPYTGLKGY